MSIGHIDDALGSQGDGRPLVGAAEVCGLDPGELGRDDGYDTGEGNREAAGLTRDRDAP
jgi:hypothetical protein